MLRIARVVREEGRDMEHYLPVLVLGVDRSLSSLVVSDIQTSSVSNKQQQQQQQQNIDRNA